MQVPSAQLLLDIDRDYRGIAKAAALPVLHTRHGELRLTAAFSRDRDWVLIYYSDARGDDGQVAVVTERRGPLAGRRVVRGLEAECARVSSKESP